MNRHTIIFFPKVCPCSVPLLSLLLLILLLLFSYSSVSWLLPSFTTYRLFFIFLLFWMDSKNFIDFMKIYDEKKRTLKHGIQMKHYVVHVKFKWVSISFTNESHTLQHPLYIPIPPMPPSKPHSLNKWWEI